MPFDVSDADVSKMTDDEVVAEAQKVRGEITNVQNEIAARKAKNAVSVKDESYLFWLADVRRFLMLLQARLVRLRPREREIQVARHRSPK
jgi:hypothetical protein